MPQAFVAATAHIAAAEVKARDGLEHRIAIDPEELATQGGVDARMALGVASEVESEIGHGISPLVVGGLLAMMMVAIVDHASRRRGIAAAPMIDLDFERRAPVIVAPAPARAAVRDAQPAEPGRPSPLRHFSPDAPPVKTVSVERSRPDYIRIDDATEVWTPARVEAERTSADVAAPARRRRTDAPGADYRFHRLNPDGSVKTAERRKFVTDVDAHRFAESLSGGHAVEVWLGERRLTTIPPDFFS